MKASARSIFSLAVGLGLAALTLLSALFAESAAIPATALGLLAVYGIIEILIHSYTPRRAIVRSIARRARRMPDVVRGPKVVRVPALVEFPVGVVRPRAA